MVGPEKLALYAKVCSEIGDASADAEGFVRIKNLLEKFQTQLFIRPLLVEGMIAQIKSTDDAHGAGRWAVLVDSESCGVSDGEHAIREENRSHPLPTRMRFTIAHELAHSIAFRPGDFGFRLITDTAEQKAKAEIVEEIERATDTVTPLLLIPGASLKEWLRNAAPLTAESLARYRAELGVSRQTLINRLKLLNSPRFGECMQAPLRNLAIGVAEWGRNGYVVLRKWPLFSNFDNDVLPSFLIKLQSGADRASAQELFGPAFTLGDSPSVFAATAGTSATPHATGMMVTVTLECVARRAGQEFLFAVQGRLIKRESDKLAQRRPADGAAEEQLQRIHSILKKR